MRVNDRLKREITSLTFILKAKIKNDGRSVLKNGGKNVLKDINLANECYELLDRKRKNLLLGLLFGRSVDTFTSIFLELNALPNGGNFKTRINRIVRNNLSSNRFVISDLHIVRCLRNDLFHEANKYHTIPELHNFVYHSVNCMIQLCNDI